MPVTLLPSSSNAISSIQRLRDALGDAAVHLALDQQRVARSARRRRPVTMRARAAPARSRCRPRRPRRACRTGTSRPASRSRSRRRARRLEALGPARRVGRGLRQLGPRDADAGRAGHAEALAGDDVDVGGVGLEQVRRPAAWPSRAPRAWRLSTALPPTCSEREPIVPRPRATLAVSECTTRTSAIGTPSVPATSCAYAVSWPWPCAEVPVEHGHACRPRRRCTCRARDAEARSTRRSCTRPMPSCTASPRSRRAACSARSAS